MSARSACVVAAATPERVRASGAPPGITIVANRLGALITGAPLGGLPVDLAAELPGPVYDVIYNAQTGWLAVTIYRGESQPVRWDNRPDEKCGYPRVEDILGARTPLAILAALDVPAAALGYVEA